MARELFGGPGLEGVGEVGVVVVVSPAFALGFEDIGAGGGKGVLNGGEGRAIWCLSVHVCMCVCGLVSGVCW